MIDNLSPITHRLKIFFSKFKSSDIIEEVLDCYEQKLPEKIGVTWERQEDGYLVGNIIINQGGEKHEFFTQGQSAQDFIEMVNDAIYAYYEIPFEYTKYLGGYGRYTPPATQMQQLKDEHISKSFIGEFKKKEVVGT